MPLRGFLFELNWDLDLRDRDRTTKRRGQPELKSQPLERLAFLPGLFSQSCNQLQKKR